MSLSAGTRVGSYEITGPLGSGGMGDVYRARDIKLGRDIALKVLPELWLADADRRERFDREARLLASLNHPNIAAIYGVEDTGRVRAIVLELVEGPTLADRITQGPVSVRDTLALAVHIADALDAAHERGIVHRDLKPANIKIAADGRAKVLDFGLAKIASGDGSSVDLTHSPTITRGATREGVLLGTAAYMSPEQARGKVVDKRTDIWAFGCVLYEMLTGRPAFARETLTDTLAAVVQREPEWDALPDATPPGVRRLLQRCLRKDAKRRLRDIGDALLELQDSEADPVPERSRAGGDRQIHYQRLTDSVGMNDAPAMSPDGKMIAFVARAQGRRHIWIRLLAGGAPLQITRGDLDHEHPRWLPDSSTIVFHTPATTSDDQGTLREVSALGGPSRPVASAAGGCDVSHDGRYLALFRTRQGRMELIVVDRDGVDGDRVVTSLPQIICTCPRWSPDDQWLAFQGAAANLFQQRLYVVPARGGEPRTIVEGTFLQGSSWVPDGTSLVYSSSAGSTVPYPPTFNLRAVARDGSSDRQITFGDVSYVQPDVHAAGRLLACRVDVHSNVWKIPVGGTPLENARDAVQITRQTGHVQTPSASPDGREIVFLSDSGGHGNLWVMELEGGNVRQLTFERDPTVTIGAPLWSPSGRHIVFIKSRGATELWLIGPDGRGLRRIVERGFAACWSRDGQSIYYTTTTAETGELFTMKLAIEGGGAERIPDDQISRVAVTGSSALYYPARLQPDIGGWDWEIRFVPADGGEPRVLGRIAGSRVPLLPAFIHIALAPDEQSLATTLIDGTTTNVWALPTAGGALRQVTDFGNRSILIARSISWAPDSRHVYAALAETNSDVVLLDGVL